MISHVPFNLEAEQSILGCVLIDNNILMKVSDELDTRDFYDIKNQNIFNSMRNLYRQQITIDYTTLHADLENRNVLNNAGGLIYLNNILNSVFTTANIDDYIQIVKDSALKRSIIAAANSIAEAGGDGTLDSTEYIDYAERLIFDLSKRRKTDGFVPISTVIDNVTEQTLANRGKSDGVTGIATGFSNLDELTLGLQNNNLIILAARPAMGKSAFAMNIAINAAKMNVSDDGSQIHVAVFSLEMSQEQIVERISASESGVAIGKIQKGDMSNQELMFFEDANNQIKDLNVHFCDTAAVTIADIRAKCRKQKQSEGLDLVVIDYLQLISGSSKGGTNRQEEVSNISRGLKQMARELEIPVIALAQLSREVEKREDKRPIMADLRESGSIEQDADLILFLYRDEYYNKTGNALPGVAELIVAKNRAGASGMALKYLFKGENALFSVLTE